MIRNILGQRSTARLIGLLIAAIFALNIGGVIQLRTADAQNLGFGSLSPFERYPLAGQAFLVEEKSPYQIQEENRITNDYLAPALGFAVGLLPSYNLPALGPYLGLALTPTDQNPGEFNPQDYSVGYQRGYSDGSFQNPFGYSYGYVNPYSQSFQIGYNDGYQAGFIAVTGVSPFAFP